MKVAEKPEKLVVASLLNPGDVFTMDGVHCMLVKGTENIIRHTSREKFAAILHNGEIIVINRDQQVKFIKGKFVPED